MSTSAVLLLALLLPFHLLSLVFTLLIPKPNNNSSSSNNKWRRSLFPLFSIPLVFSATIFVLSDLDSPSPTTNQDAGFTDHISSLNLKIANLESVLEENINILNSKTTHLDENNKLLEEMEHKIQFLQNSLSKLKTSTGSSTNSETTVSALEEEVRLLWADSRKNNFNYHILESKVCEEENKVKDVTSEVEKMENIVSEQWIQIRQLEQSLQMIKIMTSNVHKKSTSKRHKKKSTKSTVSKFIQGIRHHHVSDGAEFPDAFFLGNHSSKPCISRAFQQLQRMWLAVKQWHYELQDSIKWALEINEFTAPLANKEVTFFLASSIVVVPIMSAWALFL